MEEKRVIVREVWRLNMLHEFALIDNCLRDFPFASFDTEFPGTVIIPRTAANGRFPRLSASQTYQLMRANVDSLKLIQLGLTLSDAEGNLPDFGTDFQYVWQFNFRDFDVDADIQNRESIELLKSQGIDFMKNRIFGVDSRHFAHRYVFSGLGSYRSNLTWVTFHGAYDFGFVIKMMNGGRLPENLKKFMGMVRYVFGPAVYDVKQVIRCCDGLYGGLEAVAKALNVERVAGRSHQAGSDSLLTMQTFLKLEERYFIAREGKLEEFKGVLFGLELEQMG